MLAKYTTNSDVKVELLESDLKHIGRCVAKIGMAVSPWAA
jgi:hypothetical protein